MKEHVFFGEVLFIFAVVIFGMIRLAVLGLKYDRYLKEHHFEKWKEITSFFGFGPGMTNSYRAFKFLFSKEDFGDNQLTIMKAKLKNTLIFSITSMIALPLFFIMILVLTKGN